MSELVSTSQDEIIHESKITLVQWGILILSFFAYVIEGFDIVVISYTAPAITEDWGVDSQAMGLVFSAGLLGMTLGAMLLGSLADIYGRRYVVSSALIIAGVTTMGVSYCTTVTEIMLLRLAAGLALGILVAALPSLVGEFSPKLHRTFILSILFAGAALGAVLGGLVSAVVIVNYGWQSIFFYAGLLTMILGGLICIFVPETISFVLQHRIEGSQERVNSILKYIGQDQISELPQPIPDEKKESATVVSLLSPIRKNITLLVWLGFFLGFMVVYFLTSWSPQIMVNMGMSQDQAIRSAVLIAVGGMVGTPIWGFLGRWWSLGKLVALGFLLGGMLIVIFGVLLEALNPLPIQIVWSLLFLIGVVLMGAYANLYTIVLTLYPAQLRSTGLGWCSGVGRAGAVLSPALAGVMIGAGVTMPVVFVYFAVPALAAAACIYFLSLKALP